MPVKFGARFSRKLLTPSRWSSVWNSSARLVLTQRPSSFQSGSTAWRSPRLIACTASGGLAAIRSASAIAVGSKLVVGDDPADETDPFGLGGIDDVAGEHQLGGALAADERGEPPDARRRR